MYKKLLVAAVSVMGLSVLTEDAQASQYNYQCPPLAKKDLIGTKMKWRRLTKDGVVVKNDGSILDGDNGTDPDGVPDYVCLHVAGSDGFFRMADGTSSYSFGYSYVPRPKRADGSTIGRPTMKQIQTSMISDTATRALKAELPAPLIRVVEGQEVFLTLSNVPFVVRPDLFDTHTVHWHGFPNASAIFDGIPEISISPNPLASVTYYYKAVEVGTFMYHCHSEATEHMQMGMLGNLYVEPKRNFVLGGDRAEDMRAYDDGDGSTAYDKENLLQIHNFDPEFHDASFTVQPLPFAGMHDRLPMFNGRGYPDTINWERSTFLNTPPEGFEDFEHAAQPLPSRIVATAEEKVLIRLSSLATSEYYTIHSPDIPFRVVGQGSQIRRGPNGDDLSYDTHQVTIGGGQAFELIMDTTGFEPGRYFIYTSNLNLLANYKEDYGGMMTEIFIR